MLCARVRRQTVENTFSNPFQSPSLNHSGSCLSRCMHDICASNKDLFLPTSYDRILTTGTTDKNTTTINIPVLAKKSLPKSILNLNIDISLRSLLASQSPSSSQKPNKKAFPTFEKPQKELFSLWKSRYYNPFPNTLKTPQTELFRRRKKKAHIARINSYRHHTYQTKLSKIVKHRSRSLMMRDGAQRGFWNVRTTDTLVHFCWGLGCRW